MLMKRTNLVLFQSNDYIILTDIIQKIELHLKSENVEYYKKTKKPLNFLRSFSFIVRAGRLELPHLAAPDPKSGVSTNSTTPAKGLQI